MDCRIKKRETKKPARMERKDMAVYALGLESGVDSGQ